MTSDQPATRHSFLPAQVVGDYGWAPTECAESLRASPGARGGVWRSSFTRPICKVLRFE